MEQSVTHNYLFASYLLYLAISLGLTIWVARVLFRNGRVFLLEVFHDNTALTDAVNKLLVVGFYLINIGYISLTLSSNKVETLSTLPDALEYLSVKVGLITLILGGMHFLNLIIFFRLRKRSRIENVRREHITRVEPIIPR
jgi:hypothetical protein